MIRSSFSLLALGALMAACAAEDVVVGVVTTDSGAGGAPCKTKADCPANAFCSKQACGDATGVCALAPLCDAQQDQAKAPSCGCSGVTFWNDCVRKQWGEASSTPGECALSSSVSCMSPNDCPGTGASCNRLWRSPNQPCPMDFRGTCWVLPVTCPTTPADPLRWDTCKPHPPGPCDDTCTAIQSGEPHHEVPPSTQTCH